MKESIERFLKESYLNCVTTEDDSTFRFKVNCQTNGIPYSLIVILDKEVEEDKYFASVYCFLGEIKEKHFQKVYPLINAINCNSTYYKSYIMENNHYLVLEGSLKESYDNLIDHLGAYLYELIDEPSIYFLNLVTFAKEKALNFFPKK